MHTTDLLSTTFFFSQLISETMSGNHIVHETPTSLEGLEHERAENVRTGVVQSEMHRSYSIRLIISKEAPV